MYLFHGYPSVTSIVRCTIEQYSQFFEILLKFLTFRATGAVK